jgi:hypothetical protein
MVRNPWTNSRTASGPYCSNAASRAESAQSLAADNGSGGENPSLETAFVVILWPQKQKPTDQIIFWQWVMKPLG